MKTEPAENITAIGGGEQLGGFVEAAKEQLGEQMNSAAEEMTEKIRESVKGTVGQAQETAKNRATDYVTQHLPNFTKTARWLKGLSVFSSLGFLISYLEGLPWYVMFFFGYIAGVASTALVVFLLYKSHRLLFITEKVAQANADPNMNNIRLVQMPVAPGWIARILNRFRAGDLSINS